MKLLKHTHILLSLVAVITVLQLAKIPGTKDTSIRIKAGEKTTAITDTSIVDTAHAVNYSEKEKSWSFSAQVLEIKDVSIYGRPGSIARIQYMDRGTVREAWTVLRIDDYLFSDSTSIVSVGDTITLRVSGNFVSAKGLDWSKCPPSDDFCQHASFIEGGFPISEDYGGLSISPSNILIYSGSIDEDWINGMLAWRIYFEE
jgi:hypothetical protein